MKPVDMSPEAVTRRLRQVDQLRELCLALAGPRLKRPRGVPPAPSTVAAVSDRRDIATDTRDDQRRSQTAATKTSGNVPDAATNRKTS